MKHLCLSIITLLFALSASAQELMVTKFSADPSDISAVSHQVLDGNGDPCALVKVGIKAQNPVFEGDIIKTEDKDGEYWVYMVDGARYMNIKSDNYIPLRYDFDPLAKNTTYIMQVSEADGSVLQERPSVTIQPTASSVSIGGRKVKESKPVVFDLILVPAGMFKMGATAEQKGADDDEKPDHWVTISKPFYIGETEVSQELWEHVMGENPSKFKGDDLPVESISVADAEDFVKRLSTQTGAKFRLPTEAEWEYAARGGNKVPTQTLYSGGDDANAVAWHIGNCLNKTHEVKSKTPNALGLYNMSGNVFEICQDAKENYGSKAVDDPVVVKKGAARVRRGGAWDSESTNELRVAFRRRMALDGAYRNTGLRVVMEAE